MKFHIVLCITVLLVCAGGCRVRTNVVGPSPVDQSTFGLPPDAPCGDAGADLVVAFYRALLQKETPTLEQEQALFGGTRDTIRKRLIRDGLGRENEPVILNTFRLHKEKFFPPHLRALNDVRIFSSFQQVRMMGESRSLYDHGYGYVQAVFQEAASAWPDGRNRTIVFEILDGKIIPDMIWLDGLGNQRFDEFYDRPKNNK